MKEQIEPPPVQDQLNVLIVGNNPIELSSMLAQFDTLHGKSVSTETAFDSQSILDRLARFRPNFILIDDNLGQKELNNSVKILSSNKKTKDVPITVLKNSNYKESGSGNAILDYVLKKSLTVESLYSTIRNSIKGRKTQLFLYKAYNQRKRLLLNFKKSW